MKILIEKKCFVYSLILLLALAIASPAFAIEDEGVGGDTTVFFQDDHDDDDHHNDEGGEGDDHHDDEEAEGGDHHDDEGDDGDDDHHDEEVDGSGDHHDDETTDGDNHHDDATDDHQDDQSIGHNNDDGHHDPEQSTFQALTPLWVGLLGAVLLSGGVNVTQREKVTGLVYVGLALIGITGVIHLFGGIIWSSTLLILNGLGYLALGVAWTVPFSFIPRQKLLVSAILIVYTLITIVGYFATHSSFDALGVVTKVVEVLLVIVIGFSMIGQRNV